MYCCLFILSCDKKLLSLAFAMEWEENKILEPRPLVLHIFELAYTVNFFLTLLLFGLFFLAKEEITHELSYLVYSGVFTELLQQMQLKGLQVSNQLPSLYASMFLIKVDG